MHLYINYWRGIAEATVILTYIDSCQVLLHGHVVQWHVLQQVLVSARSIGDHVGTQWIIKLLKPPQWLGYSYKLQADSSSSDSRCPHQWSHRQQASYSVQCCIQLACHQLQENRDNNIVTTGVFRLSVCTDFRGLWRTQLMCRYSIKSDKDKLEQFFPRRSQCNVPPGYIAAVTMWERGWCPTVPYSERDRQGCSAKPKSTIDRTKHTPEHMWQDLRRAEDSCASFVYIAFLIAWGAK